MTYTPEQHKAMNQLQVAIDNALEVFDNPAHKGLFECGWTLIIGLSGFLIDHKDIYEEDIDNENALVSNHTSFTKPGQMPMLSLGMVEMWRDKF